MARLHRFLALAILWLVAASAAAPLLAQSFPKPPDVQAYVDTVSGVLYRSGTTPNVIGDGSATGGTPPVAELAEVNAIAHTGWTTASGAQCLTIYEGGTCNEAKVRFTVSGFSHCSKDDPIRNYSQPGKSHYHCFWGNASTNGFSTYASLRSNLGKCLASGGGLNCTAYWVPAMMQQIGGKWYAVRNTGSIILYYEIAPSDANTMTYFYLGLRYVTGWNMDDGGAWLQTKIDQANAQAGTAGRYSLCNIGDCEVLVAWKCTNVTYGETSSDRIANADGSDAFAGKCAAGDDFWVQFKGASCWDGVNLWSPGGYKHVIPAIWDNVVDNHICPNGWYRLPTLQFQIHYPQDGPTGRANMKLSSDISSGKIPGTSFHTDWFNGWNRATLRSWLEYCIGVQNIMPSRECNSSAISATESLISGTASPLGRNPMVQSAPASATDTTKMFKAPDYDGHAQGTIHAHGGGS